MKVKIENLILLVVSISCLATSMSLLSARADIKRQDRQLRHVNTFMTLTIAQIDHLNDRIKTLEGGAK